MPSARPSLLASTLAGVLALCAWEGRADALPEDDSNYFKLDLRYTYDHAQRSPGPSFFRSLFELQDLFFLDSRDIELHAWFYSPFELQLAVAKWGFFDYHLAIGVDAGYLLNSNVSASTRQGNSFYINDLSGNRFGGGVFARYSYTPSVVFEARYGVDLNRYRASDHTPAGFTLPANNLSQSVDGKFKGSIPLTPKLNGVAFVAGGSVWHEHAHRYGVNGALGQFRQGQYLSGSAFLDATISDASLLGGISGLYGTRGSLQVGEPLVSVDPYETILYGFSERQLPLSWGALQRSVFRSPALFSFLRAQLAYALLVGREEQTPRVHAWAGWSAGLEVPVPIPHVGNYRLLIRYAQAQANLDHFDVLHPTNYQVTASLGTSFVW